MALNTELSDTQCIPLLLHPHLWIVLILEIVISAVSMLLNCGCTVGSYYALPIPFYHRRAFAIISLNYAFLAAILLAKKCFFVFAVHYPCISIVSTISCKLQEFPTVFVYLHASILPLVFAAVCVGKKRNRNEKGGSTDWTNACSIQQTTILLLCIGISLIFTAFDQDFARRLLLKCSIVVAIQQKNVAFWLITFLVIAHCLSALFWQIIGVNSRASFRISNGMSRKRPVAFDANLLTWRLSFRDIILFESIAWLVALFFTGVTMVEQFVSVRECVKCTIFAIEMCFTFLPLLVSLCHPIMSTWLLIPVRRTLLELFPLLGKFIPAPEAETPPLPPRTKCVQLPNSSIRILITETGAHNELSN
ncbi:hypothetical protein DdX_02522 [Ditylenchus destructor]|uniref:Uncharacterized protein n=1 Tax=Ditylenchus destructor TaxID=166010 RepID=A0AAD4NCW5_9BILA|nr:hypothetical protein DdX_02522 [Ditylenchus destructor]